MKLNVRVLSLAAALVAAASWTLCSLFVAAAPVASTTLTASLYHLPATPAAPSLSVTATGFVIGLIGWTAIAAVLAACGAALYNRLTAGEDRDLSRASLASVK